MVGAITDLTTATDAAGVRSVILEPLMTSILNPGSMIDRCLGLTM